MKNSTSNHGVQFAISMLLYAVLLVLSIIVIRGNPGAGWTALMALIPLLPGVFAAFVIAREIGSRDEFQRQIQLEALSFAFGATSVVALAVGLLENAGLPRLNGAYFIPIMMALWGIGQFWATRRYR